MPKNIFLDKIQESLVLENLDENGRLPCIKAFRVAKLINLEPKNMSDACKSIGVKITNCELGVFGKIEFGQMHNEIYESIQKHMLENKKVNCEVLWKEAQKSTLRKVGSTVKNSDVFVVNCQLGCFNERKGHASKS